MFACSSKQIYEILMTAIILKMCKWESSTNHETYFFLSKTLTSNKSFDIFMHTDIVKGISIQVLKDYLQLHKIPTYIKTL